LENNSLHKTNKNVCKMFAKWGLIVVCSFKDNFKDFPKPRKDTGLVVEREFASSKISRFQKITNWYMAYLRQFAAFAKQNLLH